MSYKSETGGEDLNEQDSSPEAWFLSHKIAERAAGREPLSWSAWLDAKMPTPINETTTTKGENEMNASAQLSAEYRTLVETANLDWQVQEYVRTLRALPEHSANEVKAEAIAEIAGEQHGLEVFLKAVAAY